MIRIAPSARQFPQAFSHLALINAAHSLSTWEGSGSLRSKSPSASSWSQRRARPHVGDEDRGAVALALQISALTQNEMLGRHLIIG